MGGWVQGLVRRLEDRRERSLGEFVAVGSSTDGLDCPRGSWTIKRQSAHPWQHPCRYLW